MDEFKRKVKAVIADTVGGEYRGKEIPDDLKLVGNILDSMAVTKLMTALEENFGFAFEDEDLSAESFETVASLYDLVRRKTKG
jgi:acyl carrier protein